MREAIKMLAAESLLEIVPNYGPRVRLIEDEELKNMLEVIAVLEATAGEQACKEISGEEMENIRSLHNQMLQALDDGDTDSYFSLNRQIHSAIVAASKNETLQRLYDSLSGRIQVARYSANKTERQWTRSVKEHKEMIVLLDNRNGPGLFKVLREHVRSQQGIILSAYGVERERMKA
jgi:DNA-binding GntR family transcriptional regulator